ncbi:MAG: hypothetical protein KAU20_00285 [Nanoarchaeota archaeon]|nr:hypothetical protein [Nanoarchaeota archaeon]
MALKPESNANRFYHIEVSCSLTSGLSEKDVKKGIENFIRKRFNDSLIIKGVNNAIKNIIGEKQEYEKIAVVSNLPVSREKEIIEGFKLKNINILKFEDIMCDVILDLDTQYYRDDVIRTLQLTKYLLLAQPDKLAMLLDKKENHPVLNQKTRQKFVNCFLNQEGTKKLLKNLNTKELAILLKHSKLRQPEILAEIIIEEILGKKSKKRFLNAVIKQDKMKGIFKKPVTASGLKQRLEKKNKPLMSFFVKK